MSIKKMVVLHGLSRFAQAQACCPDFEFGAVKHLKHQLLVLFIGGCTDRLDLTAIFPCKTYFSFESKEIWR